MSADQERRGSDVLEDAERYQRLFVLPAVEAMAQRIEASLQPILSGQKKLFASIDEQKKLDVKQNQRLDTLEGSQKKAMIGWGIYASIAAAAIGSGWGWIKSKIHVG